MSGIRLLHGVDGQGANGVDAQGRIGSLCIGSLGQRGWRLIVALARGGGFCSHVIFLRGGRREPAASGEPHYPIKFPWARLFPAMGCGDSAWRRFLRASGKGKLIVRLPKQLLIATVLASVHMQICRAAVRYCSAQNRELRNEPRGLCRTGRLIRT